jgi:cytochrome P450
MLNTSDINIYSHEFQQNAFQYYEEIRNLGNVVFLPQSNCFIVVGYAEVKEALSSQDVFSSEPLTQIDDILLSADGEKHHKIRKILQTELINLKKAQLPNIEEISLKTLDILLNNLKTDSTNELVYSVVNPYAFYMATLSSGMIDVPNYLDFVNDTSNFDDKIKTINDFFENWDKTYDFINPIVDNLFNHTTCQKLFEEIQEIDSYSKDAFAKFIKMFVVAGTETTSGLMASALFIALSNRDVDFKTLDNEEQKNDFLNESLRLYAPAQITFRKTTCHTKLGGIDLPVNSIIALAIGAANRDAVYFENPLNYQNRRNKKHLSFGYGRHRCIGEHLGLKIAQTFLDDFFKSEKHFIFQSEEIDNHSFFTFKISKINVLTPTKPLVALKNIDLQHSLMDNGYVVLSSFLNENTIGNILNYYENLGLNAEKTQPNYLYAQPNLSKEISAKLKFLLTPHFDENFLSGNLLGGVFMVKKPGANKEVDFHQDWSLVDEREYISYNLWCPLVDTVVETGSLMIIDKSDKAGLPFRSSTFPPLEVNHDKKYDRFIKKFTLKAGDAILYKHSMFHGSDNNTSKNDRIAIACGIIPNEVPFVYQHWNDEKSLIETYEVDQEFYINHIHEVLSGNIPAKYQIIKETPFKQKPTIEEKQFYKSLRKVHGVKRFFFFD